MCAVIILGRIISALITKVLFGLCFKECHSLKELGFISYCGFIKGSFALCLVFKIPDTEDTSSHQHINERGVIVTSTVSAIIVTILIFGSLLPLAQDKLAPATPETQLEYYDFEDNDKNQEEQFSENARLTARVKLDGSIVNSTHDESTELRPSQDTSLY